MSITVESPPFTPTSPRRRRRHSLPGASRPWNLYGKRGEIDLAFITEMIYAGRPRYGTPHGHVGVHEASLDPPRFLHANPLVYEPWRSFKENDEPRVGLPGRSSSSSFCFPSLSLPIRIRGNPNCELRYENFARDFKRMLLERFMKVFIVVT